MDTMRAAVFESVGKLSIKEVAVPDLQREDQILVKVEACSICGTDVHITANPPGYEAVPGTTLGHEFVGKVVQKGDAVKALEIGDRIVVNPNDYCGTCTYCRKNLPNLCEHIEPLGIEFNGAFADYCLVSQNVAHKISEEVSREVAACTEPLACAINGINKVSMKPGESVVIIGCGPIGLMLGMLAKASGISNLFLLEAAPYRIEFAEKLNLGQVIDVTKQDAWDEIEKVTGIGADYVFDVTGSQIINAVKLVRKGGEIVLFGVNKKSVSSVAQCEITTKEITVHGTWLANATFPMAVKVLEEAVIPMEKLITDVINLDGLPEGIEKLRRGEAVKIVVTL